MSLIHAIIKTKIFILEQVRENTERFRNGNNQTKTNTQTSFILQHLWKQFAVET
jgi:hypothetical protein